MKILKGYGYSLWLVPLNWKNVAESYNMKHIPHITVQTNMNYIDPIVLSNDTFTACDFSNLKTFPKMYGNDPLNGSGFYCKVKDLEINHQPHMTVMYSHNIVHDYVPPANLECKLYIADTQTLDASQWKLV